jgi:DNA-directed RNA polymerase specialized sigma24 family protein
MRFRRYRDGDAFAELVQKHGPIVWGPYRQVLGSHHDAEDAFQATFLILAQHAPNAHRVNSLAGWL